MIENTIISSYYNSEKISRQSNILKLITTISFILAIYRKGWFKGLEEK